LVGGGIENLAQFTQDAVERYAETMKRCTVEHLVRHYGTEIDSVVAMRALEGQEGSLLTQLTPARESIGAEVRFAVEAEMAVTLSDVVFRRTGLGTVGDPGESALCHCAEIMKMCLGWSDEHTADELKRTQALFRRVNKP
jgi:glycerol-3-phosphate dehydrogenase